MKAGTLAIVLWTAMGIQAAPPGDSTSSLEIVVTVKGSEQPGDVPPPLGRLRLRVSGSEDKASLVYELDPSHPGTICCLEPGSWTVHAEAQGYWSPGAVLVVTNRDEKLPVQVSFWPTGTVEGNALGDNGEPLSGPYRVGFSLDSATNEIVRGRIECEPHAETAGRFVCRLPRGRWDLRLQTKGFSPIYLWDQRIKATSDLGSMVFRRGGSVAGFVEPCGDSGTDSACRVKLEPLTADLPGRARDANRLESLSLVDSVDEQGFFQFLEVPPGSYVVTARRKSYADRRFFPVQVHENAESRITHPLVLEKPVRVSVSVDPESTPGKGAWKVSLSELGHGGAARSRPKSLLEEAGEPGLFYLPAVDPGNYRLEVRDQAGDAWWSETIAVQEEDLRVDARVDVIAIEGTVSLGERPLAADLGFALGRITVSTSSGEDGAYFAYLPKGGDWKVRVKATSADVSRVVSGLSVPTEPLDEVSTLDIALPDTEISGRVVDSSGLPVNGASVKLFKTAETEWAAARTGEDGRFVEVGFDLGETWVEASSGSRRSERQLVNLTKTVPTAEIELVLRDLKRVSGRLFALGVPVIGAAIEPQLLNTSGTMPAQVLTDATGAFSFLVPSEASELAVVIRPPSGLPLSIFRFDADEEQILELSPVSGSLRLLGLGPGGIEGAIVESSEKGMLFLLQGKGAILSPLLLEQWSQDHGIVTLEPGELTIPKLAPGRYLLCQLPVQLRTEAQSVAMQQATCLAADVGINSTVDVDASSLLDEKDS